MKKICLSAAGVARNKYVGVVDRLGVLPFRLNVGADEIFEIRNADGSERGDTPLLHGDTIALKKSGTENFFDMNGCELSPWPSPSTGLVIEKMDLLPGKKINDGDKIALRGLDGWLSADCCGLKVKTIADWSEATFQIYEIPGFSAHSPLELMQCGKAIDFLPLGPHGRPAGGDARVHVKLDRTAPPGGIIVAFHFDSPEHEHVCIPCILLDGVREGFAPIHFARLNEIPEAGFKLSITAEISSTKESSLKFYGQTDGMSQTGIVSLSVHKRDYFEAATHQEPERRGPDRRVQDRRTLDRRALSGQKKHGFDNHFLERRKPQPTLYS